MEHSCTVFLVMFCFLTCRIADAFIDGPLQNGNFEQPPNSSDLKGTVVLKPHAIPKWHISGFVEYIKAGQKQGDMLLVVPEGYAAVRLGNEASIKQLINVTKGASYAITLSAARTCAQDERLNVSVAPDYEVIPIQTLYSSDGWDLYAFAFRAVYDVIELLLHNPGSEEDPACGPLVDSIAIRFLKTPQATKDNLIRNGDFEEGAYMFPNISSGVLVPPISEDDHSALPAWKVDSLKAVKYIDSAHFSVPHGKRAIELVGGRESAIGQDVGTIVGQTYELTFAVGDASNSCEGSMIVEAFAGRETLKVPYESKGRGGYKRAVLRFVARATRTRVMFFSTYYHTRSTDYASLCGPVVDDVKLASVPSLRRF